MKEKTNSNQSQHDSNANSVPNKQPNPYAQTVRSRLDQGIPYRLAQVVPAELRVTSLELYQDGRPVYVVTKDLIYGTAEDIVEYLMDSLLLCDPKIELDIFKVDEGIDGSLYILNQFIVGGDIVGLINHFSR